MKVPARVRPPVPAGIRDCRRVPDCDWFYEYFDRDDELLYVGVAFDAHHRALGHRSKSLWWRFVADGEATLYPARAEDVEIGVIQEERPLFNLTHSVEDGTELIEYLARRDAWELVDHYLHHLGFVK